MNKKNEQAERKTHSEERVNDCAKSIHIAGLTTEVEQIIETEIKRDNGFNINNKALDENDNVADKNSNFNAVESLDSDNSL